MAQTLEQQIRRVIKQHYGEELWSFRDEVGYKDATRAFVADVARAIRGELEYPSDFTDEAAKYNKGGGIDRATGRVIRTLRVKKGVTQEQLAANIGVCADFLETLESGRIAASAQLYAEAYLALKPTDDEMGIFIDTVAQCKKPEEMIRDVIEIYYGVGLWSFKPDVGYEEAVEPFIRSLATLSN